MMPLKWSLKNITKFFVFITGFKIYFNQQVGQAMAIYQTLAAKNSESASKATQSFYKEQHNP